MGTSTLNGSEVTKMSQLVREDPALDLSVREREADAAWQVLRALARAHGSAVASERTVEHVEQPVQGQPVAAEPRLGQPPRSRGVRVVETAVLFAVAAYFIGGLVGTFIL